MRHWAWFSSYASRAAGKSPAALLLLLAVHAGAQEQLNLRLGSGQAGVASWSAAEFSWQPDMTRQAGSWQLSVDELKIDSWKGQIGRASCRERGERAGEAGEAEEKDRQKRKTR